MVEFWESLSVLGRIYFVAAGVASVVLVIQLIILIIGFASGGLGDSDVDFDVDGDADGSGGAEAGIFTVKGLIAFFAIGGWIGLGMDVGGVPIPVTVIVSAICGFGALVGIGLLYRAMYKLQSSGNINVKNAEGGTAEVYLTIPANESGTGKVNMLLQERSVELDARTKSDRPIPTGSMVKVVETIGNTVIVEPLDTKPAEKNK